LDLGNWSGRKAPKIIIRVSFTMTEKCPICQEDLLDNIGVAIPCGHCFHRECYEGFQQNSQQTRNGKHNRCCICKKKVKTFHKIFLSFETSSRSSEMGEKFSMERDVTLQKQKMDLEKRHRVLQTDFVDQSETLTRLINRQRTLEVRRTSMKQESKLLKQELNAREFESWQLRFDCYEVESKLSKMEVENTTLGVQLEEMTGENKDLHHKWEKLEQKFEAEKVKRKSEKTKMKVLLHTECQQLEITRKEMQKVKEEKMALELELAASHHKIFKLKRTKSRVKKRIKIATGKHKKISKYRNLRNCHELAN